MSGLILHRKFNGLSFYLCRPRGPSPPTALDLDHLKRMTNRASTARCSRDQPSPCGARRAARLRTCRKARRERSARFASPTAQRRYKKRPNGAAIPPRRWTPPHATEASVGCDRSAAEAVL